MPRIEKWWRSAEFRAFDRGLRLEAPPDAVEYFDQWRRN